METNLAAASAPPVTEPLTWTEICARYPDQWVCLVEIRRLNDTDFTFTTARVAGHGTDPRTPLEQASKLRDHYDELGHYFTGRRAVALPRVA